MLADSIIRPRASGVPATPGAAVAGKRRGDTAAAHAARIRWAASPWASAWLGVKACGSEATAQGPGYPRLGAAARGIGARSCVGFVRRRDERDYEAATIWTGWLASPAGRSAAISCST